ncbi:MAG: 2-amino-4-hydroxy-6-hydroxymethyldihydropteridine diphosphokinase [Phycisphaerales bacterium]|jgi:2-amino-4-hydroxy-6-hydroxymethyldihydropteridine diphosphokinase|nr:2-amino-4-hydroxy-6-hydroxymethyldihydropteridine diphosphokinase [Phycisphaerales bacterium]
MQTDGVFIALGSNVGDRAQNLDQAVCAFNEHACITIQKQSEWIETEPVGPIAQANFLNGVIRIKTTLTPCELLEVCLQIEQKLGRVRTRRWGPRTIDLDIVLFGSEIVDEVALRIPHLELQNRAFVLEPLAAIEPDVIHPETGFTAAEHLNQLKQGQE